MRNSELNSDNLILSRKIQRDKCRGGIDHLSKYGIRVMMKLRLSGIDPLAKVNQISSTEDYLVLRCVNRRSETVEIAIGKSMHFRYEVSVSTWSHTYRKYLPIKVISYVNYKELDSVIGDLLTMEYPVDTKEDQTHVMVIGSEFTQVIVAETMEVARVFRCSNLDKSLVIESFRDITDIEEFTSN